MMWVVDLPQYSQTCLKKCNNKPISKVRHQIWATGESLFHPRIHSTALIIHKYTYFDHKLSYEYRKILKTPEIESHFEEKDTKTIEIILERFIFFLSIPL